LIIMPGILPEDIRFENEEHQKVTTIFFKLPNEK